MSDPVTTLLDAIASLHDCRCTHAGTEVVRVVDETHDVWTARVELFDLQDHPEARVAYGWLWTDKNGKNCLVGVLKLSPVRSATDAVLSAIASDHFFPQNTGQGAINENSRTCRPN